jgi:hypothetical protein
MGIDLTGIQHEYQMRGAHADAEALRSDESIAGRNGLVKGDIYSVIKAYDLEEDVLDDDYLLISNFTAKAFLAKMQNEKLRDVDLLNDYYLLIFEVIQRYSKMNGMKMVDVIRAVADGVLDLENDIFPLTLNALLSR